MNNKETTNLAIKTKLINLINTQPKDSCIKTRINLKSLDLLKFIKIEEILEFINFRKNAINLNTNINQSYLRQDLESINNLKDFLNYLEDRDISINKVVKNKLIKKFDLAKEIAINNIIDKNDSQKKKITFISKQSKTILENTGIQSLYIGSLFLSGKTKEGTLIDCPLIFYPIEMHLTSEGAIINHISNNIVINERIFNLLKNEYNTKTNLTDLFIEVKRTNNVNLLINEISKILDTNLKQNYNCNEYSFFTYNDSFLDNTTLKLTNNFVLGIFEPTGGALKEDLEKLVLKEKIKDPFINVNHISKNKFVKDENDNKQLLSINGSLNIYQKYAIRSALEQNTLIFGPPGTGKSEVISNIIANALVNRKSTLVVAEKKVALNVLMDRLNDLSNFTLFICDLKNTTEFYNKILWIADKLDNLYFDQKDINDINKFVDTNELLLLSHKHLKNYFETLEKLIISKDQEKTTFLDYLRLNKEVKSDLLNFVKESNSIKFISETIVNHSFKNFQTFREKILEYINFLKNTKIDSANIHEILKCEKRQINDFQIKHNTLSFITEFKNDLNKLEEMFVHFLKENKLINDKKFINLLKVDISLLSVQKQHLNEIKNDYSSLFNNKLLEYFILQKNKITSFLKKYKKQLDKNKYNVVETFLQDSKFEHYTKVSKQDFLDKQSAYISMMEKFLDIPHNTYSYLINLNAEYNSLIFDKNIVLIYFNEWLKKSYIVELGNNNFTFFNSYEITNFKPVSTLTSEDFHNIEKILNFEKQIISQNKMDINLQNLIDNYEDQLLRNNNNIDKRITEYYLENLKSILLNLNDKDKKKIEEIFSIAKREKNKVPIKQIINNYYKELKLLFPIWVSLPELVAQLLPLEENIFEYGIFDEASQIFMERAYPIVYRCKINIVAGDDKQLKPTSFFSARSNNIQDYDYTDNDQVESLLDRANVALWPSYYLRNHYRSIHRDLIQFSNDFIYNKQLNFISMNGSSDKAFEVLNVEGQNIEGINEVEANKVSELIQENIDKYNKIIVVAFGQKQSNQILEIIEKNSINNQEIIQKYNSGDLIITNLENVQGNEGDLVILSVSYGKDSSNNYKGTFGPLLTDGGINRLNVAVTRAKQKMIVVKSFMANEMNYNHENHNAYVLWSFINYCDQLNENIKNSEFIRINNNDISLISSSLKEKIMKFIANKHNYFIVQNYDIGSKILDFAILEKHTNKTVASIIISKLSQNTNVSSLFELVDSYIFIKNRGYNCYLLDEYYWITNEESASKNLINWLKSIIS